MKQLLDSLVEVASEWVKHSSLGFRDFNYGNNKKIKIYFDGKDYCVFSYEDHYHGIDVSFHDPVHVQMTSQFFDEETFGKTIQFISQCLIDFEREKEELDERTRELEKQGEIKALEDRLKKLKGSQE